jgi:localization factor PodJL
MNSKRTYLDTLNTGRQRRASTTLEQITQSLQNLENRLDRSREVLHDYSRDRGDSARPQRPAAFDVPRTQDRQVRRPDLEPSYRSLPRDFDRIRDQEEGIASAGRIAGELKSLREDLRQQVASNMQTEFEALRGELGRMLASSGDAAALGAGLASEIDRISHAISNLSERTDDRAVGALRTDIEQVRAALDTLAREETVRSSHRRWDEFDRRWTAFENRVDERHSAPDPEIAALSERLQSIGEAVNGLPESLSLRSLEDKLRTLAGALDHFVNHNEHQAPEMFRLIEERLDEISRAIVASTAAVQSPVIDPEPFQRIEARISALARQIDELVEDRPSAEVVDRLNTLSQRVDELAAQGAFPERAMEHLSRQVLTIAEKLDRTPADAERQAMLASIDQRFDVLSAMIERRQGDAIEHGNLMFRDLERRLDDVAERIDLRTAETLDTSRFMDVIDARFAELTHQLAGSSTGAGGEMIRGLEKRLENISARIDANASKFAGIDPDLIRSLENQVAALSGHLSRPSASLPELEDIGPRITELERHIAGNRESILQVARQAAEAAMRSFDGSQPHLAAVDGLTQDLKALETLTRRSDERNTKTFEAIHDTLIKIVDRLGTLETGEPAAAAPRPANGRVMELDNPPPLHAGHDDGLPARSEEPLQPKAAMTATRSPAEAAAEAAIAAVGSDRADERPSPPRSKSLLSGLTRALGRKDAAAEPRTESSADAKSPVELAVEAALDEPLDPKIANRPLEPGSGTPDLNAIMRRVREERGQNGRVGDNNAAKADFIAAARRAAQAAAAEAEIAKRGEGVPKAARGRKIANVFRKHRKPILMAATAIMVVLAGLQLGKAYFGRSGDHAAIPLVAEKLPETAALDVPFDPPADAANDMDDVAAAQPETIGADRPVAEAAPGDAVNVTDEAPRQATPVAETPAATLPADTAAPATVAAVPTPATDEAAAPAATTIISLDVPDDAGPQALREAAEAGDAKALFELGSRYADGRGIKADMQQAASWYEKSAELGFAPAQYRIGNLYEKAMGVERDVEKAKTWYQLAAEQGNASAMHNLAVLYAMGADGTTDNESAARWFRSAADLGVKDSQFNLGILAAKGVGVPQSLEESYKWFALAAKAGDRDAGAKRDEIANSLRPEQLTKARADVEAWKAKPLDPETNSVEIPESWQEAPTTTAGIDMKKAIGNIQRILNKNGYDAGGADGVMGERTKNAIMAFQKDNGMAATGEVDEKLVRALLEKK